MKKILIFIALYLFVGNYIYADKELEIKLSDKNPKETKTFFDICNLFVSKGETDSNGNSKITIEIENLSETNVILLFGRSCTETELKKSSSDSPSIRFDKKRYPKDDNKKAIEQIKVGPSDNLKPVKLGKDKFVIVSGNNAILQDIQVIEGEKTICRLPFYIAQYKPKSFWSGSNGKNKLQICEKRILDLEIEVELKPDENYLRLEREINELIEEVKKDSFCPNPMHETSLEEQKSEYIDKINKIISEINTVLNDQKIMSSDTKYEIYNSLKQNLNTIVFKEVDCGKHKNPPRKHTCQYCTYSAELLFRELDNIYIKIDNCNNQKNQKKLRDKEMQNINLMFKCPVLSKKINDSKNKKWKSKITDRYNRIKNF